MPIYVTYLYLIYKMKKKKQIICVVYISRLGLTGGRYHPTDYSFYTKYPQLPVLYAYGYNGTELTYTDVLVDDSGTVYANGSRYNSGKLQNKAK